jgi:hypothetical protein
MAARLTLENTTQRDDLCNESDDLCKEENKYRTNLTILCSGGRTNVVVEDVAPLVTEDDEERAAKL